MINRFSTLLTHATTIHYYDFAFFLYYPRSIISLSLLSKQREPSEVKDPPFVCDQNWEKEAWKKEAKLWESISEMYPGVTEAH